jgi:stage II sporulation protein D
MSTQPAEIREGEVSVGIVLPGEKLSIVAEGGRLFWNGEDSNAKSLRIIPRSDPTHTYLRVSERQYRGTLDIRLNAKGLITVVNVLAVEEYLLSVVPCEMPHTWPTEALKAQAVASRTYALYHLNTYAAEGFDVLATSSSQAYCGVTAEKPETTTAVAETKGQVVKYQGKLANTLFFSSSGGHTENNEIVFSGAAPVPYLRGVPDFDEVPGNNLFAWKISYDFSEVESRLDREGIKVGTLLQVSPGATVGVSGRPATWKLQSGNGEITSVPGAAIRTALALPSMPRSMSVRSHSTISVSGATEVFVTNGSSISARKVSETYVLGADGVLRKVNAAVNIKTTRNQEGLLLEVSGGGFGHSVGMSQWGANGLAQKGASYIDILLHYYPGTSVDGR